VDIPVSKIKREFELLMRLYHEEKEMNPDVDDLIGTNTMRTMEDRFWLLCRVISCDPYMYPVVLNPVTDPDRFENYCRDILGLKGE
jgi:hypothetical protein